jgi:ankyrin repeat protein
MRQTYNELQRNISSGQGNLQNLQNQLHLLQIEGNNLQQVIISEQQNMLSSLGSLLAQFAPITGVRVDSATLLASVLPNEEIAKTELIKESITKASIEKFDEVLSKINDVNFKDNDDKTMLMHCLENGFYYGVDKLLSRGADVNLTDNKGANALIYATSVPNIKYIELLADKTTNLNQKAHGFKNQTVLHFAVLNTKAILEGKLNSSTNNSDKFRVVKYLESRGATFTQDLIFPAIKSFHHEMFDYIKGRLNSSSFSITNSDGDTPFLYACRNMFFYGINKLISEGLYNINVANNAGTTPLMAVSFFNSPFFVKKFATELHANIHAVDNFGRNSIHQIALSFSAFCTIAPGEELPGNMILIHHGTITSYYTENAGQLQFIYAREGLLNITSCSIGSNIPFADRVINTLTSLGVNINAQDNDGRTPFHYICQHKFGDLALRVLNKHNIDVVSKDNNGWNGLLWSIELGDKNVTTLVLNKNVDINAKNNGGGTALYCAVYRNNLEITKLLLDKGADVKIADNQGYLPWHLAAQLNFVEILKILHPKMQDIDVKANNQYEVNALHLAAKFGALDAVKYLISQSANKFAVCKDIILAGNHNQGYSALHLAALNDKLDVVKYLIDDCQIPVNPSIPTTVDPFYLAMFHGSLELIQYMISKGANVKKPSDFSHYCDTPLHGSCYDGRIQVMQILKTHGANHKTKGDDGKLPLHCLIEAQGLSKEQKIEAIKCYTELFGVTKQDLQIADNSGLTIDQDLHNVFSQQEYEAIIIGNHLDQ